MFQIPSDSSEAAVDKAFESMAKEPLIERGDPTVTRVLLLFGVLRVLLGSKTKGAFSGTATQRFYFFETLLGF